jgi:hypothetical protein
MLIIYRVVRRAGWESMTVLPEPYDMSKPKMQVSTGIGHELSVSPTVSIRGCDSPYNSLPPPYAKDPFNDFPANADCETCPHVAGAEVGYQAINMVFIGNCVQYLYE